MKGALHRRKACRAMQSSQVTQVSHQIQQEALGDCPSRVLCHLLNELNREPDWNVESGPEEGQKRAGRPAGGHDSHPGNRWCLCADAAVVPIGVCWEGWKPPGLVTAWI